MAIVGSVDAVTAAIRDEANAELERVNARRDEEIARLRELPPPAAPGERERLIAAAQRRNAELLAQMEWEEKRGVIEQREQWIARVIRRGNEILAGDDLETRRKTLARCVREATASVRGDAAAIHVAAADRPLLEGVTTGEAVPVSGGCIVRLKDLVCDNSYEARAQRFEPIWRRALAAMYHV